VQGEQLHLGGGRVVADAHVVHGGQLLNPRPVREHDVVVRAARASAAPSRSNGSRFTVLPAMAAAGNARSRLDASAVPERAAGLIAHRHDDSGLVS
jgi:hypothetical protein